VSKILVMHSYYGCETGCCGHVLEIDEEEVSGSFDFDHPPADRGRWRAWAEEKIREVLGEDHVADLDWENCEIIDD